MLVSKAEGNASSTSTQARRALGTSVVVTSAALGAAEKSGSRESSPGLRERRRRKPRTRVASSWRHSGRPPDVELAAQRSSLPAYCSGSTKTARCWVAEALVVSSSRPQWQVPAQTGQLMRELRKSRAAEAARHGLYQLYPPCYFRGFLMRRRTRWFNTAAMVCQLFPGASALTNRFLLWAQEETSPATSPAQDQKAAIPTLPAAPANTAIIRAKTQEKAGDLYTLRGEVEIDYRNLVFRADEASYTDATGQVTARCQLLLDDG